MQVNLATHHPHSLVFPVSLFLMFIAVSVDCCLYISYLHLNSWFSKMSCLIITAIAHVAYILVPKWKAECTGKRAQWPEGQWPHLEIGEGIYYSTDENEGYDTNYSEFFILT